MVTTDVMKLYSIFVKVVKDSKTEFITLSVVWLRNSAAAKRCAILKTLNSKMPIKTV
jgi:hypothetical protein